MDDYETTWDINLRANLRLWPAPAWNIERLAACFGETYDEDAFLEAMKREDAAKAPGDTRSVRNTYEALAQGGLVYRSGGTEDTLQPTSLGMSVLSFVLGTPSRSFANEANRHLLAPALVRALSLVVENRVVWGLMRRCNNILTNEELNRAMARITRMSEVDSAAEAVCQARAAEDVSLIGARIYKPDQFGTAQETDQRKAINPHFLLAGGGGWFIELEDTHRRLLPWAVELVDNALEQDIPLIHASTAKGDILRMSSFGAAPVDPRWSM
jgi:hypothetical protein